MYYAHFGLTQAPFKITPNTDFFFGGGNRGPILEALIYAIKQGEGIVKVSGEVGTGKTMLCSMLQTRLPAHVETIYLANPSVSPDEILHAIGFELQLGVDRSTSRLAVTHAIQEHLLKRHAEGKRVVLFVEESQGMPIATLEEIRLLSNLETKSDKLLQIVLFGQPELDENLRQPQIRQLKERITHSFRLEPLTAAETREYVMFRLRTAGYRGPDLFTDAVVREIRRISGGLTRRINLITDKALLAAFAENTHSIRQKHVDAAVRDSEFAQEYLPPTAKPRLALGAALVVLGMAAGASLFAWLGGTGQSSHQAASPSGAAIAVTPAAATLPTAPEDSEKKSIKIDGYVASPAATPVGADAAIADQPVAATPSAAPNSSVKQSIKTKGYTDTAPPQTTAIAADLTTASAAPVAASTGATPPSPGPANTDTLLQERLAATTAWLAVSAPKTYTVQLFSVAAEQQLNQHLKYIGKIIEINSIFVYRTIAKGRPVLLVTWGSYDNRRAARQAMARLPTFLQANNPLVRTVGGIRAEIDSKTPS